MNLIFGNLTKTLTLLVTLTLSQFAQAEPITLTCISDDGIKTKLEINIQSMSAIFAGARPYKIVQVKGDYITLTDRTPPFEDAVGGEYWLLDRSTGEYQRAAAFLGSDTGHAKDLSMTHYIQHGTCKQAAF